MGLRLLGLPYTSLTICYKRVTRCPSFIRARRGLYVGVSLQYSTTVSRVLNLTGHILDHYHCVYEDTFSTVSCPLGDKSSQMALKAMSNSTLMPVAAQSHSWNCPTAALTTCCSFYNVGIARRVVADSRMVAPNC
jgi:hypothetical protein